MTENKIREIRRNLNMTQEELSTKSGVSRTTIVALEKNQKVNTSTKTLTSIASALGVTLEHLFLL